MTLTCAGSSGVITSLRAGEFWSSESAMRSILATIERPRTICSWSASFASSIRDSASTAPASRASSVAVVVASKSSSLSRPLVSLSGTIFVEFSKNKTSLDGENFNS